MKFVVILAGLLLASPALAQEPTDAEKSACKPDAMRICKVAVAKALLFGDRKAVVECLVAESRSCQSHWRCEVSRPCRDVLTKHGL